MRTKQQPVSTPQPEGCQQTSMTHANTTAQARLNPASSVVGHADQHPAALPDTAPVASNARETSPDAATPLPHSSPTMPDCAAPSPAAPTTPLTYRAKRTPDTQAKGPLLPLPQDCILGSFVQRRKRFSVELALHGEPVWVHSNNSGSMLGLTLPGSPVLASPAANPNRKLKYTQECVWLAQTATPDNPAIQPLPRQSASGFWVGVNTSVPNRMLEAAFHAGRLHFAKGYTSLVREAKRGQSRLDGLMTGPGLPPLWVECKNVTMVEDDAACFPDAASERGQKHLRELMDIAAQGERAAMFYLVQRPDGRCFAPADFIDPDYARLFYEALACGVEVYPYRALVGVDGIDLGGLIPLRPAV